MKIEILSEQQILQEGWKILIEHWEPAKVMCFRAACHLGEGDYLKVKEQLFAQETVDSLYEKIKTYQDLSGNS